MRTRAGRRGTRFAASAALVVACAAAAWADEYTVSSFTGGYVDANAPGATAVTDVFAGRVDDKTTTVSLPFAFPFFGRSFDKLSISTNGWAAFGAVSSTESNNT